MADAKQPESAITIQLSFMPNHAARRNDRSFNVHFCTSPPAVTVGVTATLSFVLHAVRKSMLAKNITWCLPNFFHQNRSVPAGQLPLVAFAPHRPFITRIGQPRRCFHQVVLLMAAAGLLSLKLRRRQKRRVTRPPLKPGYRVLLAVTHHAIAVCHTRRCRLQHHQYSSSLRHCFTLMLK